MRWLNDTSNMYLNISSSKEQPPLLRPSICYNRLSTGTTTAATQSSAAAAAAAITTEDELRGRSSRISCQAMLLHLHHKWLSYAVPQPTYANLRHLCKPAQPLTCSVFVYTPAAAATRYQQQQQPPPQQPQPPSSYTCQYTEKSFVGSLYWSPPPQHSAASAADMAVQHNKLV